MTQHDVSTTPSVSPKPARKGRLRRWTVRGLRVAAIVYVMACLLLYVFQNWIIFPGAYVHNHVTATAVSGDGRELLALRTRDGHPVAAVFAPALEPDGTPMPQSAACPTILYFYGNGDCMKTSLGVIDAFRRMGANVLCPEYVGYPLSGGTPSEAGLYATADAAWASLQGRPDVDPRKIVIVGRSLGGAAAVDLAARHRPAGLALFSAFTTMDEMARKVLPMFPTGLFLRAHFNNEHKLADVTCPVFLAHGTADDFVPYSMMGRLAGQVHTPLTTYPIQHADHNNIFHIGGQAMLERIAEWMRSLPSSPPSQ